MDQTKKQFLALLRAGLWGQNANPIDFPKEKTDWKEIFILSQQQAVIGIAYDGLSTLPIDLQPETNLLRQWYAMVVKIEQQNHLVNEKLAKIYTIYENEGFTPVLLKGQGIAQCYLNPLRRQSGDIDLYLGKENYIKAKQYLLSEGIIKHRGFESMKHLSFGYEGVEIENHHTISKLHNILANKYFQEFANDWFQLHEEKVKIKDIQIKTPPIDFNNIFILIHLSGHFFSGGIGLRQLCDWVRLIHKSQNKFNIKTLDTYITQCKIKAIWNTFGFIAVHYLGLPEEEMPFYTNSKKKYSDKCLNIIFEEGNFGQNKGKIKQKRFFISRKIQTAQRIIIRLVKILPIFPIDTVHFCFSFLYYGIINLKTKGNVSSN